MSARAKPNRYCVSALERGIRILSLFEHYPTEISGAAVARELQLPRATAFRLLRTLELLGRLERAEGGAYRIGPAVPRRGSECRASLEVTQAARSAVDQLRDRTRCSTYLVVRDARDAVVVLKAASVEPGINLGVGMRRPLVPASWVACSCASSRTRSSRTCTRNWSSRMSGSARRRSLAELERLLLRGSRARLYRG